jgi:hypothetical protein
MSAEDAVKVPAALAEWWTLAEEEARAKKLDDVARADLVLAMEEASDHRRAAHVLYERDMRARGLAEARVAYATLVEASRKHEIAASEDSGEQGRAAPRTERDFTPRDADAYRRLCEAHRELEAQLLPYGRSLKDIGQVRFERRLVVATVFVLIVSALLWLGVRRRITATASAFAGHFGPEKVLDLKVDRPWILPDATPGWIDLTPSSPRTVSRVRVCPALGSYSARGIQLDLYRRGKIVKTISAELDNARGVYPVWRTFEVGETDVERVRLSVLSWSGQGGGIGEIELLD